MMGLFMSTGNSLRGLSAQFHDLQFVERGESVSTFQEWVHVEEKREEQRDRHQDIVWERETGPQKCVNEESFSPTLNTVIVH